MKQTLKISSSILIFLLSFNVFAQKKVQKISMSYTINAPASKVWEVVGDDYANIYKSHPKVITSNFINNSTSAQFGSERVCNFNDKGSKYIKERITEYDSENYSCKIDVYEVKGFPINSEYTYAIQRVIPIDDNTSTFEMEFHYRTKPGLLGGFAKGSFKKGLLQYAMAVEHYILTGEEVTKDNFKAIWKANKHKS
ncbi:SRPBCC family protein [Winogradskyella sp. 3972H.M.0a.05]|uniref:SRPBCC family protein n=1 Tax=Winogradskyella sp. 3972H.M.0a.05 TaxID=2950277 RepID=UPI0033925115